MPENTGAEQQRQMVRDAVAAGPECLTDAQIERLAAGEYLEAANQHVRNCARCDAELALRHSFDADSLNVEEQAAGDWIAERLRANAAIQPKTEPVIHPREPWYRRWWMTAAVSMAGLTIVAGVAMQWQTAAPTLTAAPENGPTVLRSDSVILLQPAGDLRELPGELSWKPVQSASTYDVSVTEVDQQEVWKGTTPQTSLALPGGVRSLLVPGKTLLWQVTARNSAGSAVASSARQRFRLAVNPGAQP